MANEKHLAILRQGVQVWNQWRAKNFSEKVNLAGITFRDTDLRDVNLVGANLNNADLSYSDMRRANLNGAFLCQSNLTEVYLRDSNLNWANFRRANLTEANLQKVQALATIFKEANFTGACIEDWHTNSITNLEGVICDYVYLRHHKKERRPSSGDFATGEFTNLFQKSLETIDLIFRNGIDWDAFAYSFKKLEVENQGAQLDVQSIEKKGDGILVVRVAVAPDVDKAKIESGFMQGYDFASKALEAQYQTKLQDKDAVIVRQEAQINWEHVNFVRTKELNRL